VRILVGLALALLCAWLLLAAALLVARPRRAFLGEAVRLLPDTLRMLGGLATDRTVPRGARIRLWLLSPTSRCRSTSFRTSSPCSATPTTRSWP